ncbi:EFR1 family ferrodoxin [Alkaliphilus serpentinus]|uniref:Ferredoxin n=1 Tax=Alkaliphilus serpentinus TaxID=1482731 RepID=A0A833HL55_9FIRM|nr:EFR1 family ferrodoxin [Alkaliphilus serpentinus]KAB3525438.1 hypothetical protein F8153_15370 [Alkaliphilus serpentinus]
MKLVYYFSGTGNSYYAAKIISQQLGATLLPVLSLKKGDSIKADFLCFVFPIYDFKAPKKVLETIENLSEVQANSIVAIATYGVALSKALYNFNEVLEKKGAGLSQGYGIKFPHNAVGSISLSQSEISSRLNKAEEKLTQIVYSIKNQEYSTIEKTSLFEDMTIIKQMPVLLKFLYILLTKGANSLKFNTTKDCTSCGQCVKICPVDNIQLKGSLPVFGDNCTSCFACIQWCPQHSIHMGKYSFKEIYIQPYRHPKVKATDLM